MNRMEEVPMGTSTSTTISNLNWETCPEEVIWTILKYLSSKCLVSCMTLNRWWKIIVLDFIESRNLWPKIISETMANMGHTYQNKSVLSYKEILMNSLIWPFIPVAKMELYHAYELSNIRSMHVYKEKLILTQDIKTDTSIKYFNIKNTELIRIVDAADDIDCIENDHMVLRFDRDLRLCAYYKTDPNDNCICESKMHTIDDVLLYRLVDNVCYIITENNVVWTLTWNGSKWVIKARGRYYGDTQDTIRDVNEFNEKIYMVTKHGYTVTENKIFRSFHKVKHSLKWAYYQGSTIAVLLNKNDVALSVSDLHGRTTRMWQETESEFTALICQNMTCAIAHGEVVFIGYKDGAVAICLINNLPLTNGHPDRLFHVQDFDRTIDEPSVLALDVFEDKLSHHLFVATRNKVLQLLITYPDQLRAYYE